ncbi:uncharacterized protein LOC112347302 [Selaginella moellendorffii]|uniref:uncharacterized protein LOC112347302 n=1 Tax=Selaginella moellendorffii TaxID=88036 RepID=UPI000D1C2C1E|nr:uncharacterized protein LOC112347302 [Selaginella moellendorffii]|eukprot:XP_024533769.1 uncharacterized protein LOC112347302 [Selaginella moellendorffii]
MAARLCGHSCESLCVVSNRGEQNGSRAHNPGSSRDQLRTVRGKLAHLQLSKALIPVRHCLTSSLAYRKAIIKDTPSSFPRLGSQSSPVPMRLSSASVTHSRHCATIATRVPSTAQ